MPEPLVVQVMQQFKADLLRREATQMQAMARRWLQVENALQDQIELFARRVTDDKLTVSQLHSRRFQLDRYASLLGQVRRELDRYTDYAVGVIANRQRSLVQVGINSAATAIRAVGADAGVRVAFDLLPIAAVQNMVGLAGDGSPLRSRLVESYGAAADGMLQELIRATALGKHPRETARRMVRNGLSQSLNRMLTTARTEPMRVFRESSRQQYAASGVVEGFMRLASRDSRTCMGCLMADGETYQVGESLREHPQGRCGTVPMVTGIKPPVWQRGTDWFLQQPPALQRNMLGNGRFNAWKDGKFDLDQLATVRRNATWGDAVQPTPLRDLLTGNVRPMVVQSLVADPAPVSSQPVGTPVRNALELPRSGKYSQKYEATLQAIAAVHGDGTLPTIAVKTKSNIKPFGYYQHLASGQPDHIAVNGKGDHHELTLAHEIGHFLDHQGIAAPKRFASHQSAVMAEWRDVIKQSKAVQDLQAKRQRPSDFIAQVTHQGQTFTASPSHRYVSYLLDERELWARSYAQYIATRSGNAAMLQQLDDQRADALYGTRQWADDDFVPIAEAIDTLFARLGWRR